MGIGQNNAKLLLTWKKGCSQYTKQKMYLKDITYGNIFNIIDSII